MKNDKAGVFPKSLQWGDCIGLVGPASPIPAGEIVKCVELLKRLGYSAVPGETLKRECNLYGYLAADAKSRAGDINRMFADNRVAAVFCTRGGYGSAEVLEYLDYDCIRQNPKIFVGYSDITCIHIALAKYCGFVTFHGPMVWTDLLPRDHMSVADTVYSMKLLHTACNMNRKMIFQNPPGEEIRVMYAGFSHKRSSAGRPNEESFTCKSASEEESCVHEGRLFGGNLSVLAHMLGTPFSPVGGGEILFLEEVGESIAHIHMYLIQMKSAGLFDGVKGILLGAFTDCKIEKYDEMMDIQIFLQEWFTGLGIPVLQNICSDHRKGAMATLPLGARCRMDTEKVIVQFGLDYIPPY